MPTDVIKTIGQTSSPVTPDYPTLALWIADCPANLMTADQRYIGECLDQGVFTGALLISGITTDATRYVLLRCAAGASFKDKAGVRTTPLIYNESNGVAINVANPPAYAVNSAAVLYTRLEGLQIKRTGSYGDAALRCGQNARVTQCIVSAPTAAAMDTSNSTGQVVANCLFTSGYTAGPIIVNSAHVYACTFINTAGSGTCFESRYSETIAYNCAVFGFATFNNNTMAAGTDYNGTDLGSVGTGTHNVTSLVFANQFTNSASDWRASASGGLHAGIPDANYLTDISGTVRSLTTPWIGAWEVTGAGPTPSSSISPSASARPASPSPSARPSVVPSASPSPSTSATSVVPALPTGRGTILRSTIIIGAV